MEREKRLFHLLQVKPEEGIALALDWYGGAVKTICQQILFDCTSEDQEEAIADTFLRLWQSAERFQEEANGSLKSYLYGIARHTAIDKRRSLNKQNQLLPLEETTLQSVDSIEQQWDQKEEEEMVRQTVDRMEEPDRSIFILRYYYYATMGQIAKKLNLTSKQVENRLYRGKEKLKRAFIERGISK